MPGKPAPEPRSSRESHGSKELVREGLASGGEFRWVETGEEALAKVAANNLFRPADGGEVDAAVPG